MNKNITFYRKFCCGPPNSTPTTTTTTTASTAKVDLHSNLRKNRQKSTKVIQKLLKFLSTGGFVVQRPFQNFCQLA